jgi:hypothetical protein
MKHEASSESVRLSYEDGEPEVAGAITTDDVIAWFKSKIPAGSKIAVGYDSSYTTGPFTASVVPYDETPTAFASTLEEAVEKLLARILTPAKAAEAKRLQAAKLLAEAQALEAGA